jgi:hypothetical protein
MVTRRKKSDLVDLGEGRELFGEEEYRVGFGGRW